MQYDAVGRDWGKSKKKLKSRDRFKSRSQSGVRDCKYCGSNHPHRQCPAYGKIARHFAKGTILPKSAGLIKAKTKLKVLVVPRNHSDIGKLM